MSVDSIRSALLAAGRSITRAEARSIIDAANDHGEVDAAERAELTHLLATSTFSEGARSELSRLLNPLPVAPVIPSREPVPVPTEPEKNLYQAKYQPWTTTYWPMASNNGDTDGSASSNLWSKDGPLDKFDALLKARGLETGARKFELTPNLNGLVGKQSGHYVASSSLSEKDAERTTGVDFNGNGKIDADVEYDFIDGYGQFGRDGKTDGTMSVGWWGSCDKVALAGVLFQEPKKAVTVDGVTFSPQDIKGLLTVIADSQGGNTDFIGNRYDARQDYVTLKNGQRLDGTITTDLNFSSKGVRHVEDYSVLSSLTLPDEVKIKLADGTEKTLSKNEIKNVAREDRRDDAALFHKTIIEWLDSGRPAVMDKDSGEHVWNYNFHKAEDLVYADGLKPSWASDEDLKKGFNGPAGDGKLTYVERSVELGGGGGRENWRYWLEEKNGKVVNSGWASGSSSPDFLWRPQKEATFEGANQRNPFVSPALVKELYEKSIAP